MAKMEPMAAMATEALMVADERGVLHKKKPEQDGESFQGNTIPQNAYVPHWEGLLQSILIPYAKRPAR